MDEVCRICGKLIVWGELCEDCAEKHDYYGVDVEDSGGWMVQDSR